MRRVGFLSIQVVTPRYCFLLYVLLALCFLFVVPCAGVAEELRGSPAAHVLPGEFASEHWDFTARFESGHLLFLEFVVTNIGLGDRNAAVFGHIIAPDGTAKRFSNGRTEKYWALSADRLRMEIGNSVLDMSTPAYKVRINKRSVRLDVHVSPDMQPLWAQTLAPPGYALDLLAVAAPIEGTLWLKGMSEPLSVRGRVAVTHSWTNTAGSTLVLRRIEFFSLNASMPVYGLDLTAPNGTHQRWIVARPPDREGYQSEHFELSFSGELQKQREQGYAVPRVLRVKNAELDGQIRLESQVLQADPFIDLPRPVRYLVSLALDLRPRRIWAQSQFEMSCQMSAMTSPIQKQGDGITAVTFLNPLPTTVAKTQQFSFQR